MLSTSAKPISEKFTYLGTSARRMLVTHCINKLSEDDWLLLSDALKHQDKNTLGKVLDSFLEIVFNQLPFATTKEMNNAPNLTR